jgi:hypothetical protein
MKEVYTDECVKTFAEEVANQLDGKEGYLVELGTAEGTVKLLATVGNEIGIVRGKLQPGHPDVAIRLLGKGGTANVVAGGVIAKGARVIGAVGGKVVTIPASATSRALGRKLTHAASADNHVIQILDIVETVTVA